MPRNPQIDRLISIIEPVCVDAGCELVDVRLLMEQGGWVLRVCIDRPLPEGADVSEVREDRADLALCEHVSRMLSATLDVDDPIPQAYSLEVSSPGIDRPLRTAAHFTRYAGAEVKIQLSTPLATPGGERRNFRGVLRGVVSGTPGGAGGQRVAIDVDGARFELILDDVESARIVPDWDDVMRGGSGVARSEAGKPGKARSGKRPDRSAGHATGKAARGRAEPARFTPSSDPSSDESPDEAQGAPSDPSPDVP